MILVERLSPSLTTVRVAHHRAGVEAARLIVSMAQDGSRTERQIVLPVELVVRGSTRSIARDAGAASRQLQPSEERS